MNSDLKRSRNYLGDAVRFSKYFHSVKHSSSSCDVHPTSKPRIQNQNEQEQASASIKRIFLTVQNNPVCDFNQIAQNML